MIDVEIYEVMSQPAGAHLVAGVSSTLPPHPLTSNTAPIFW